MKISLRASCCLCKDGENADRDKLDTGKAPMLTFIQD